MIYVDSTAYYLPAGVLFPLTLAGFLLVFATLHLAKLIGRLHGALAKAMLVSE